MCPCPYAKSSPRIKRQLRTRTIEETLQHLLYKAVVEKKMVVGGVTLTMPHPPEEEKLLLVPAVKVRQDVAVESSSIRSNRITAVELEASA